MSIHNHTVTKEEAKTMELAVKADLRQRLIKKILAKY